MAATPVRLTSTRPVLHLIGAKGLAGRSRHRSHARQALSPDDPRQNRALAPILEKPHPAGKLLPTRRLPHQNIIGAIAGVIIEQMRRILTRPEWSKSVIGKVKELLNDIA
jgi:hypothetical protein